MITSILTSIKCMTGCILIGLLFYACIKGRIAQNKEDKKKAIYDAMPWADTEG